MAQRFVLSLLTAVTLASACVPIQIGTGTNTSAVEDGVRQTLNLIQRYSAASQWDSLATLYADDVGFRWVENGTVRYRSVAEIRRGFASLRPGTRIETRYEDTEIIPVTSSLATVVTRFQTRFIDPRSPDFRFGGAITMTLTRTTQGWRILGGHTSSANPRAP
jgi:hypothetical protein